MTAQRAAEQARQRLEQQLSALLEQLPVGISILDEQRQLVYTNPAMTQLLGFTTAELRANAHHSRTYLRPDGSAMPASEIASARAMAEQRGAAGYWRGAEDGSTLWVMCTPCRWVRPAGQWQRWWRMRRRGQVEQALRASERWRARTTAPIMALFDRDGVRYVSSTVTRILGYDEADFHEQLYTEQTIRRPARAWCHARAHLRDTGRA